MKTKTVVTLIGMLLLLSGCAKKEVQTTPQQFKPGTVDYIVNEACFYLNNGRVEEAEQKFLIALKKDPEHTAVLNGLGIIALNRRDFDEAEKYFKTLITVNPSFVDAHNSLGIIYIEKKEYDLAREHLLIPANTVGYSTPENAYYNLANLEIKRNDLEAALRYIEKGINKNRSFAPLFNLRGLINEYQQNYDDALFNFEKASRMLMEENVDYMINIGRIYVKLKNKEKALDILEKALAKTVTEVQKQEIRDLLASIK